MTGIDRETWEKRRGQWGRFAAWTPPESPRERSGRIRWLDEVLRLARRRGSIGEDAIVDAGSPAVRRRRAMIREGLARIRG